MKKKIPQTKERLILDDSRLKEDWDFTKAIKEKNDIQPKPAKRP
jgi:hypothetical protein